MITIFDNRNNSVKIFVKGASEVVVDLCKRIMINGQPANLDIIKKEDIKKSVISKFAIQSLRTIAIAYKELAISRNDAHNLDENALIDDLILVGVAGIKDPLRPEIPNAVKTCKKAGITIRMVTGDNVIFVDSLILVKHGHCDRQRMRNFGRLNLRKYYPSKKYPNRWKPAKFWSHGREKVLRINRRNRIRKPNRLNPRRKR